MSTLTITFPAGSETGAGIRQLGNALVQLAALLPDRTATGGSTVLTLDNAPADGSQVGVQLTGGPVASRQITVKV